MPYFTDATVQGRVRYSQISEVVGVFGSPSYQLLIGTAHRIGKSEDGLVVWSLRVHTHAVPGRWVIVDGTFVPADDPTLAQPHTPLPEHSATPRLRTGETGNTWRIIQVVGFVGLASSIAWTVTTWTRGAHGRFDALALAGLFAALGSLALTILGRLGSWWSTG